MSIPTPDPKMAEEAIVRAGRYVEYALRYGADADEIREAIEKSTGWEIDEQAAIRGEL